MVRRPEVGSIAGTFGWGLTTSIPYTQMSFDLCLILHRIFTNYSAWTPHRVLFLSGTVAQLKVVWVREGNWEDLCERNDGTSSSDTRRKVNDLKPRKASFIYSHDMVTSPGFALQTHAENLMKYTKNPSSNIRQTAERRYNFWRKGTNKESFHCHRSPWQIKQNIWWAEFWRRGNKEWEPPNTVRQLL